MDDNLQPERYVKPIAWLGKDGISPIPENGTTCVAVYEDITERRRAEEKIRQHTICLKALNEISQALAEAGLKPHAVLNTVAQRITELIGDACFIHTSLRRQTAA